MFNLAWVILSPDGIRVHRQSCIEPGAHLDQARQA